MAKLIARNASIGVDNSAGACVSMSGLTNNVTLSLTAEAPEVTGFGDTYRQRQQDGLKDGEFSFDAFMATGANETDIVLSGILGASTRWVFGPAGSGTGSTMYAACAILTSYEMTFGLEDAGQCSATFMLRSGSVTRGTFG